MRQTIFRIRPDGSWWTLAGPNTTSVYATKEEAIAWGRLTAQAVAPSLLVVYSPTGEVEAEYSYPDAADG